MSVFTTVYLRDESSFHVLVQEAEKIQAQLENIPDLLSGEDLSLIQRIFQVSRYEGPFETAISIYLPEIMTVKGKLALNDSIRRIFAVCENLDREDCTPKHHSYRVLSSKNPPKIPPRPNRPFGALQRTASRPLPLPPANEQETRQARSPSAPERKMKRPPIPQRPPKFLQKGYKPDFSKTGGLIHLMLSSTEGLEKLYRGIKRLRGLDQFKPLAQHEQMAIRQLEATWHLLEDEGHSYDFVLDRCINEKTLAYCFSPHADSTFTENLELLRALIDKILALVE